MHKIKLFITLFIMSNPSSPPTPSKNGTISLSTYTINSILKLHHPKKVDLYARIIVKYRFKYSVNWSTN